MAQAQTIRWRYRVEAVLVRLLKRCAVALPPRLTSRVGEGVGVLLYGTRAKLRYVRRNLRIAFPNLSAEQRRAIAAGNYRFFGAMLGEFLALGSLTREQVQEAVRLEDRAVLDAALARGKGVVLVTGHFGHWELLGAAVAHAGYPISAFVGGQENPLVDAVLNETREAFGVQTLGRDAGGRSLLRTLRAGRLLMLAADQHQSNKRYYVSFFGQPVSVAPGPYQMARHSGAALVFCAGIRESRFRYRSRFVEIPMPAPSEDEEWDLLQATQGVFTALEEVVRAHPEQYFWMHRRFRRLNQGARLTPTNERFLLRQGVSPQALERAEEDDYPFAVE